MVRLFRVGAALYALGAVAAAVWGEPVDVGVGLVGAVAMVVTACSRASAAPTILAVLDERDLPVTRPRGQPTSYARGGALRFVAFGCFLTATGAMVVLEALWAGVWVYGDERPAAS